MQDRETKSLWSQVTGACISGTMEGKKLAMFPSMHTTYNEFKKLYPDGFLLKKPARGSPGSPYDSYFSDKNKLGIFGRPNNFQKLNGKDKVFGIRLDKKEFAIAREYLAQKGYIMIRDSSSPVLVVYDKAGGTAVAFSLKGYNRTELEKMEVEDGRISLPGEKSSWNALTGRVISGTTANLTMIPIVTAYWFAWTSFFPNTELIR